MDNQKKANTLYVYSIDSMTKLSLKKKKGGELFKLSSYGYDRRYVKARFMKELRLNIEDNILDHVPLDKYMKRNLDRIEDEAINLEGKQIDFQFFFFSDDEVKLTLYEIQNYIVESVDKDFNQYVSPSVFTPLY